MTLVAFPAGYARHQRGLNQPALPVGFGLYALQTLWRLLMLIVLPRLRIRA